MLNLNSYRILLDKNCKLAKHWDAINWNYFVSATKRVKARDYFDCLCVEEFWSKIWREIHITTSTREQIDAEGAHLGTAVYVIKVGDKYLVKDIFYGTCKVCSAVGADDTDELLNYLKEGIEEAKYYDRLEDIKVELYTDGMHDLIWSPTSA